MGLNGEKSEIKYWKRARICICVKKSFYDVHIMRFSVFDIVHIECIFIAFLWCMLAALLLFYNIPVCTLYINSIGVYKSMCLFIWYTYMLFFFFLCLFPQISYFIYFLLFMIYCLWLTQKYNFILYIFFLSSFAFLYQISFLLFLTECHGLFVI